MIRTLWHKFLHFKCILFHSGLIKPKLKQLNIFVTNRCNFSCFYCNRNIDNSSPGIVYLYENGMDFKFEDFVYLLNTYPTIKRVSFVGIGEPFLNKDLLKMAKFAKSRRKFTSVITNGSLLHKFWGEIGQSFDSVSISLHGVTPDELHEIAGVAEPIFRQVVFNIHHLTIQEKKKFPNLSIRASVVMLKDNIHRVKQAAAFCLNNSIPVLDIQNYLPVNLNDYDTCIYDDEKEYLKFVEILQKDYAGKLIINSFVPIKRNKQQLSWKCSTFFHTLRVDGWGNVCGCCRIMIPKEENGNIHQNPDVWNNEYFIKMREKFRHPDTLPECCRYCPDSQ